MSDLKHQTVGQLKQAEIDCQRRIKQLKSELSGQQNRLGWIEKYLFEKTPKEMTVAEIEKALGHKVILK